MEFTIKGPFKNNIYNLMRDCGYHFLDKNEESSEYNFVRPPRSYPRFHIYLKAKNDGSTGSPQDSLIFNLHLDQKRPIYKGTTAHSGEYDDEVVEKEAERVKEILSSPPSLPLGN